MYLFNLLADTTKGNGIIPLIVMGVLIVAFIVMQIVSGKQRKKQMEEDQKKKDSLCPGAKVLTIGGISGEVIIDPTEDVIKEAINKTQYFYYSYIIGTIL